MKVLLAGTGRVAHNLGHAMVNAGITLLGVVGRDALRTGSLAEVLSTEHFTFGEILPSADLILIAVSDDAIKKVASLIPPSDALVVHTSGASPIDLLDGHANHGVLWPVQTFVSQRLTDLSDVPLIVEVNGNKSRNLILELAGRLSDRVIELNAVQRRELHLAAVFTSNFPVILLIEVQKLLREKGLPEDLLLPLWNETAANVAALGPEKALTGPARRNDLRTIEQHLELLRKDPQLQQIYSLISSRVAPE